MIVRHFNGVLTKNSEGYELFTHKSSLNLSKELKYIWKEAVPVKISMENDERQLFYAKGDEIYFDRDENRDYKLHIDGENIEDFLESKIGELLYITITIYDNMGDDRRKEATFDETAVHIS